jgi:hypothetical protein
LNPDQDHAVLAALANAGSDLSKPAHTIHFLYFKSRASADAAAEELRQQGFSPVRTAVAPAPSLLKRLIGPRRYSCIAETRAVPAEAAVLATSRMMEALAERHGGKYDGWEASVER